MTKKAEKELVQATRAMAANPAAPLKLRAACEAWLKEWDDWERRAIAAGLRKGRT